MSWDKSNSLMISLVQYMPRQLYDPPLDTYYMLLKLPAVGGGGGESLYV